MGLLDKLQFWKRKEPELPLGEPPEGPLSIGAPPMEGPPPLDFGTEGPWKTVSTG